MNEAEFAALKAEVLRLDREELSAPHLPIAVALQEGNDLLTLLTEDATVIPKLVAVGLNRGLVGELGRAIPFARETQSRWAVLRDRSKPASQRDREERGVALRDELLSAARWNLRNDRAAMGTLSAISEGEGVADLVQDLNDLGELIERKRDAFAGDATFDAPASAEAARSVASEISVGAGVAKIDGESAEARDLRDRAYTLLAQLMEEIREAGRHAYRDDERMRKHFTSRYLERKRRARATAKSKASIPA